MLKRILPFLLAFVFLLAFPGCGQKYDPAAQPTPEGGFDEAEVKAAQEAGIEPVTLGRRILRTETAPLAILAWLGYHLEA